MEDDTKLQKILDDINNYELLLRREFKFVPVIAEHVLEGYRLIENFSGAIFSNILYIYNGDLVYSVREEGEMDIFADTFTAEIEDDIEYVRSVIDRSFEKRSELKEFTPFDPEDDSHKKVSSFLKKHKDFTRLYIFLWLAGLSLDENIDIVGEDYLEKFNEIRNSEIFVSSLHSFFPEDKHKILSNLFPAEIVGFSREKERDNLGSFITILIQKNDLSYSREKALTKSFVKRIEEERKIDEEKLNDVDSIEGNVAQEGVVLGTTKVIQRKNDMQKMEQGDILVSVMTTPEYTPAIKKAAAILTDEGGLHHMLQ